MKQKRFTEEQKAFVLRQADSEVPIPEILRKMEISEATFLSVEEEVWRTWRSGESPAEGPGGVSGSGTHTSVGDIAHHKHSEFHLDKDLAEFIHRDFRNNKSEKIRL